MNTLPTAKGNTPVIEVTPDEQLRHRIHLFLQTLRLAILRRVQIDVQSGVVTIEGIARSYYERQMALACVRRSPECGRSLTASSFTNHQDKEPDHEDWAQN